nr:hypothetical protein [Kofleriaceae bacterium]
MRRLAIAIVVACYAYFVIGAALAPIAGGDWGAVVGDRGDACARDWLLRALVTGTAVHAVVTPVVAASLVIAIAWLAVGRAPWRDPLALGAGFGVVWLACPYLALDVSNRAVAVAEVYGAAAAAWLAILCLARRGETRLVAMAGALVLGVIAGSTAREVGTPALVAAALAAARPDWRRRAPLVVPAAVGLAIGAAMIWLARPAPELGLVLDRTVTAYVHDVTNNLRGAIAVACALVGVATIQLLRGRRADGDPGALLAIAARAAWCVPLAIGAEAVVQLGALPDPTQLAPAAVAFAVVAARAVVELARDRVLRAIAIAAALAACGFPMWHSIYEWRVVARDIDARVAVLRAAPAGGIAVVPPLRRTHETPASIGEDLQRAAVRDRVASLVFGLRAIRIDPVMRTVEPTPPLALAVSPVTPGAPAWLSGDLETARDQLAAAGVADGTRLVAAGIAVPDHVGPVVAGVVGGGRVTGPHLLQRGLPPYGADVRGRLRIALDGARDEVWAVPFGDASPQRLRLAGDGDYRLARDHGVSYAIVTCDATVCELAGVAWAD